MRFYLCRRGFARRFLTLWQVATRANYRPDTAPKVTHRPEISVLICTSINPNMIWRKKKHIQTHLIKIARGCVCIVVQNQCGRFDYTRWKTSESADQLLLSRRELLFRLALVSPTLIKMNTSRKWYFVNRWRGGSTFILLSAAITARPSADAPFWPVLWHFQILRCLPDALEQKIYICPAESETPPPLAWSLWEVEPLALKRNDGGISFAMWWAITLLNLLIESSFCGIERARGWCYFQAISGARWKP